MSITYISVRLFLQKSGKKHKEVITYKISVYSKDLFGLKRMLLVLIHRDFLICVKAVSM